MKTFNFVVYIILCNYVIVLAGCGDSDVKSAVSRNFFDPNSAEFRDIEKYPDNSSCGYVNGKNKFGGYVGFRKFHLSPDGSLRIDGTNGSYLNDINERCFRSKFSDKEKYLNCLDRVKKINDAWEKVTTDLYNIELEIEESEKVYSYWASKETRDEFEEKYLVKVSRQLENQKSIRDEILVVIRNRSGKVSKDICSEFK